MNGHTPWLGLGLSVAATVFATFLVYNLTSVIAEERFDAEVHETELAIKSRIKTYEQVLSGAKGLFVASETVTRQEWKNFVETQGAKERFPGVQGVGYLKLIGGKEQLAAHIEEMRNAGFQNYTVWPEGERDEYYAVVYLEPLDERNKRAIGYDPLTEPTRREAILLARDTGDSTITGKIRLVQETDVAPQAGFLQLRPVYENGMPIGTVDERRAALVGFVYSAFRMNDFMDGILSATTRDITFVICDTNSDPQNIMYDFSAVKGVPSDQVDADHSKTITIEVYQRQWILKFTALKSIHSELETAVPWLVLLAGMSFSVLLFLILRTSERVVSLTNQKAKNEKMVAMGEMASRLAHDLRNPLTIIKTSTDLLQRNSSTLDEKSSRYVSSISAAVERMLNQIDNAMDFVKSKPLNLTTNSVLEMFSESIKTTPIPENIKINLPKDDVQIECDSKQLTVVFSNLITNAVQVLTNGGTISLGMKVHGHKVTIQVSDSGPGIPQENILKIFEPLFTTKPSGTGLGLVSCKTIVEQHRGKISVKNSPTTFTIELPLKQ